MGLGFALSYNKKHLVGMLMNKNANAREASPRQAFDKLAVSHFDYLDSPLKSNEKWGKLSNNLRFWPQGM